MTEEEIKALQEELAATENELAASQVRIGELEQALGSKETVINSLEQNVSRLEGKVGSLNQSLEQALSSYKGLVLKSNPGLPEEMVAGDTIEAINKSVESAVSLVKRVKEGLKQETAVVRIPPGAPQRTSPDLSALSPREKIQYAIGGKK